MADTTTIEWTDATWNIINGCSIHTPGCTNCYAMLLAGTRLANHPSRIGLTTPTKAGPVWNGTVRLYEPWLTLPFEWARPRDIFVCAHGDLFHDAVTEFMLDQVFAVMALCAVTGRQHRFQVLTKRSGNMRRYVSALAGRAQHIAVRASRLNADAYRSMPAIVDLLERGPLPNVWLGVSTEDQKRADERIPDLLATPAAVRWISAEPLLGPIDLEHVAAPVGEGDDEFEDNDWKLNTLLAGSCYEFKSEDGYWYSGDGPEHSALDWVVVGGESGRGARPMHPDWARSLRDQCEQACVPYLFKQWGEWGEIDGPKTSHPVASRQTRGDHVAYVMIDGEVITRTHRLWETKSAWGDTMMARLGKRETGRLLDGVQHDGAPS